MSEKEACGNSCIFGSEKTGPGTILCDFGVHFEVQFRMFFEEKLVFGDGVLFLRF